MTNPVSGKLAAVIAIAFGVAMAVVHSPNALDAALLPRVAALALCVMVGLILLRTRAIALREPITLAFAAFVLLQWASVVQANVLADAVQHCLEWTLMLAAFILLRGLKAYRSDWPRLLGLAIASFCAVGLLLGPLLGTEGESGAWVATFGGANQYAAVLALCAGFVLVMCAQSTGWQRWLLLAVACAAVAMLWMLGSLAAWLALAIQVLVGAVLFRRLRFKAFGKKTMWLLPLTLLVVALGAGSAIWSVEGDSDVVTPALVQDVEMLHELGYRGPTSTEIRQLLYGKTGQMIADYPLLGVGAAQWRFHFPSYGLREFWPNVQEGTIQYQRAHSDYLEIWAEGGIFALLAFMALLGLGFRGAWQQRRSMQRNEA